MQNSEAIELAAQIKLEFPQLSVTVVPLRSGGYGISIWWYTFRYDRYNGFEYDEFVQRAAANGFVMDVLDNGMLVLPEEHDFIITDPIQWTVIETVSSSVPGLDKDRRPRKSGRPAA